MVHLLLPFKARKNTLTLFRGVILAVFISMMAVATAFAQVTTSSISGHVSDGKEPIAEAVVTVVHEPTGQHYYVFTSQNGYYVINNILVGGPYTVRVERLNYKSAVINEVLAPLAETVVVDAVLERTTERIDEVYILSDGEYSPMNVNRSGVGIYLGSSKIDLTPSVSRSLYDILRFTPQSVTTEDGAAIGGANYRGSYVTVDGASFNNIFGIGSSLPAGGTPISLDALEQVNINITPFNVRHSNFLGSAINMVTKHGTNEWHGSVYDYFTSSSLQGQRVGTNNLTTSPTLDNTLGFTVGGPIVKNKLFFFLNGEFSSDQEPGSSVMARQDTNQAYGGSTGYNRPTLEQMEAIQNFLSEQYDYSPGRFQNYTRRTPDYKLFARLDWRISDEHLFYIRLSHTSFITSKTPSDAFSPLGGSNISLISNGELYTVNRDNAGRNSQYALPFESAHYFQKMNFTSLAAELNSHLLNGRANNIARLTWSLQNEPRAFSGDVFPTVDILEPYTDANGDTQLAMFTTFGPDPYTYGNRRLVNSITATDEFSFKKGINNLLVGAQVEFNSIRNGYMQGGAGWYIYDSWQSFLDDVNDVEGAGPSLFMITHANTETPTEQVFPTIYQSQVSVYAQDELEFNKFFKLTAGLRLDMPFIRFRYDNRNADFDAIAASHPNSSFAGLSTADVPPADFHFSPRVGFNWDITHKREVILRGGTGLFTGRIPNVWLVSTAVNSNCLQYQYVANTETGQDVVGFDPDLETIISNVHNGHTYSRAGLPAPTNATILAKDLRMPTSWKTSLSLDVIIPGDIKGTFEAIYSYNLNEVYAKVLGYKEVGEFHLSGEPDSRPLYVSENIQNAEGATMSGYYLYNEKGKHGQYLSLTAQLSKEFRFGLSLMAAYTFSHASVLSDGFGDQVASFANTANVNDCNSPELGYATYVTPHRVIASIGYNIREGSRTATKLGLFYEGLNLGVYGGGFCARRSYLMENVSGLTSPQLIYIPTQEELAAMPFASEENRAAFEEFISSDPYLSKHRGEYSKRNGGKVPWVNRINFKVSQEIYFNVDGHKQTLDLGVDFNNLTNLFCSKWGAYQVLDNEVILRYRDGNYTFTPSTWSYYNNLSSTWQILVHVRYAF
ncbi:MAG: TonB-dependent receptor [Bacteroidales bacterium]|nr:TonB-dependent receptor [Bacteroidales bacterium]